MNYTDLHALITKNRSCRKFDEACKIDKEQIIRWIDLARLSASGRNMQPLKYAICTNVEKNAAIFPNLAWAGYLKDWDGPADGQKPAAYIVVLKDTTLADNIFCDDGIAMQSIMLGVACDGFGGCIIGSVKKENIHKILNIPAHLEILWVIALGKPAEKIVIEEVRNNNVKYWRDENEVHHVPKRSIDEIVVDCF